MRIFVAGNKLYDQDNLPLKIMPRLKMEFPEIEFAELDPTENLPSGELIVIDTVKGIKGVKTFADMSSFSSNKLFSPHDYDLMFELQLNKKLGRLKKFVIIGVSSDIDEKEAFERVRNEIAKIEEKD